MKNWFGSVLLVGILCFWAVIITWGLVSHQARKGYFEEQVTAHKCKVTPVWQDGTLIEKGYCVLPNGVILHL